VSQGTSTLKGSKSSCARFAEYDRESIRERTQARLHRALRNGKQFGMMPYGYDIAPDGSFVIVEDEARIVAEIIANIAVGATLYSEAERLNDEGEPSPGRKYRNRPRKYGPMWRATTVQGKVKRALTRGYTRSTPTRGLRSARSLP